MSNRLDTLRQIYINPDPDPEGDIPVNPADLDWLLQQAARVEELEAIFQHYFAPLENNPEPKTPNPDRWCRKCGLYITDRIHIREEPDHA